MTTEVHRQFVETPEGDIHIRRAGAGNPSPLILLHWSPGNSIQYAPILPIFAEQGWDAIAMDTWGYGDSAKPEPDSQPEIADYARVLGHLLDGLGIEKACLAGGHTGASIGVEFAVQHPGRVSAMVLDGCPLYSPEEQKWHLENYAPPIVVEPDGSHLAWAWNHMATMGGKAVKRTPVQIHNAVMGLLKAGETYHLGYEAAFRYDLAGALKQLGCPVLCLTSEGDSLEKANEAARALIPGAQSKRFAPLGTSILDRWRMMAELTGEFLKQYR